MYDTIVNPVSSRQVKTTSKLGKKLLHNYEDKFDYVINPETNKIVLSGGKVGQQVLKKYKQKGASTNVSGGGGKKKTKRGGFGGPNPGGPELKYYNPPTESNERTYTCDLKSIGKYSVYETKASIGVSCNNTECSYTDDSTNFKQQINNNTDPNDYIMCRDKSNRKMNFNKRNAENSWTQAMVGYENENEELLDKYLINDTNKIIENWQNLKKSTKVNIPIECSLVGENKCKTKVSYGKNRFIDDVIIKQPGYVISTSPRKQFIQELNKPGPLNTLFWLRIQSIVEETTQAPEPGAAPAPSPATAPGPEPGPAPPVDFDIERYNSWLNISLKQNINDPSDCKPRDMMYNKCGKNLVKNHIKLVNRTESTQVEHSAKFWRKEAEYIGSMDDYIFKTLTETDQNKNFIIRKWPFKFDDIITKKFQNYNSKTEYRILPYSCKSIHKKGIQHTNLSSKHKTLYSKDCKKTLGKYVNEILIDILTNKIANEKTISLLTQIINNNTSKYHNLFWDKIQSIIKEDLKNKIDNSIQHTATQVAGAVNVLLDGKDPQKSEKALQEITFFTTVVYAQENIALANGVEEELTIDINTLENLEDKINELENKLANIVNEVNNNSITVTDPKKKERFEKALEFAIEIKEEHDNKLVEDNKLINRVTRKIKKYWGYAKYIMYLFGILLFIASIVGTSTIPIIGPLVAIASTAAGKGIADMVMKHFEERINEQMEAQMEAQNDEAQGNTT